MSPYFRSILSMDLRRPQGKKKLFLYVAVLIVFFIVLQNGINQYKTNLQDAGIFKEIEGVKPGLFQSYSMYGTYGIRLLASPPPISALFPAFLRIAHVDTGVGMTIFNDLKRDGLLGEIKGFAGLVIFFILFVALLQGANAFEDRECMKFYTSLHREAPFWAILASRFFQLTILDTVIFIMAVIQCLANNVWLPAGLLFFFWGLLEIAVLAFLAGGMAADFFLPKRKIVLVVSLFFLSLMVIPWQMDEFNRFRADSFRVELENLKYLMNLEKIGFELTTKWKGFENTPINLLLDIIDSGQSKEYAQMKANEGRLLDSYIGYVKRKHLYASLFPTTFLLSVSQELSGGGHIALIRFNRFTQDMRDKFIRYYIQKEYREKSEKGKVVPFPGEYVLIPGAALPYANGLGIVLSLVYAAGLVFLARFGCMYHLVKIPKKKLRELRGLKIPQKSGAVNNFFTMDDQVKDYIFLEFLNQSGNITLDEKPVQGPFTYLPALDHLPAGATALLGIKPGEGAESWEVFLVAALKNGMVVTDWKLYEYAPKIKTLSREGVYLNISTDLLSSYLGENHLKWSGDQSIKDLDPYRLAGFLNSNS